MLHNCRVQTIHFCMVYFLRLLNPLFWCPGPPHRVDVSMALLDPFSAKSIRGNMFRIGINSFYIFMPVGKSTNSIMLCKNLIIEIFCWKFSWMQSSAVLHIGEKLIKSNYFSTSFTYGNFVWATAHKYLKSSQVWSGRSAVLITFHLVILMKSLSPI